MKYLLLLLMLSFFFSCEEDTPQICYECDIVVSSDENKQCGRRNDGFEELERIPISIPICDQDELSRQRDLNRKSESAISTCGKSFTIKSELICKQI